MIGSDAPGAAADLLRRKARQLFDLTQGPDGPAWWRIRTDQAGLAGYPTRAWLRRCRVYVWAVYRGASATAAEIVAASAGTIAQADAEAMAAGGLAAAQRLGHGGAYDFACEWVTWCDAQRLNIPRRADFEAAA